MKKYFVCVILFLGAANSALAETPHFGEILKNALGEPLITSQGSAMYYCQQKGMHLPTAREFAQFAHAQGAKGITEACVTPPGHSLAELIYSKPPYNAIDNKIDCFVYDATGYRAPAGEMGHLGFATSSTQANVAPVGYYAFSGDYGYLVQSNDNYAVVCAY